MAQYYYAIGTSTGDIINLEGGVTPVNPPRSAYTEWSRVYDRADGLVGADGWPGATWTFDVLTQAMVDYLRGYCAGKSAAVVICTRGGDGVMGLYSGVMEWPDDLLKARSFGGRYLGASFRFRRLAALGYYPLVGSSGQWLTADDGTLLMSHNR